MRQVLPFRIDPRLKIWADQPETIAKLKTQILSDGKILSPLLVAKIGKQKPLLYDGHTRLIVWEAEKKTIPFPEIRARKFKSFNDVLAESIRVQSARRNLTEAQIADAGVRQLEAVLGESFPVRGRGQPKKTSAHAFPSAKKLAAQLGVSDFAVRTIIQARKHPNLRERLLTNDPTQHLSLRQVQMQMKSAQFDLKAEQRVAMLKQRREQIVKAGTLDNIDVVAPDGIFLGDVAEQMKRIEAGTVSLVVTSPPYPIRWVSYDKWHFTNYADYLSTIIHPLVAESARVLRRGGRLAVNFDFTFCGQGYQAPALFDLWTDIGIEARKNGLLFMDVKNWFKQNCSGSIGGKGSRDCSAPRGNFNTEQILVFAKESTRLDGDGIRSDITSSEYDHFCLSDWYVKAQGRKQVTDPDWHPCPFPEELVYRACKLYCYPDDVVLDPFCGSGTVPFVARALGRRFIGIDNSPLHVESSRKRVATLDDVAPEERQARINRFRPPEGERADGRPRTP